MALFLLTGCGGSKQHAARAAIPGAAAKVRMEARLRVHGYTVASTPTPPHAPYLQTFSVNNLDWTSTHAFSVSVFIFGSKADAAQHRVRTARLVGHFPERNKSRLVGTNLFVATSATGTVNCKLVNGSVRCPSVPGIAVADFEKVVSIAEGR
jgi:hypothetical protein